ncbi:MAG: EAL domain-containing protein [Kangiellaceae bacterium]|nr:EAL domain-containing protein [Kangiellaceae bacterium]MCW9017805.1 EAL domain-containing protein [Kangiellaceae bacterium]
MAQSQSYAQSKFIASNFQGMSQEQLLHIMDEYQQAIKVQQTLFQIANIPILDGELSNFYEAIHLSLSELVYAANIIIATLDKKEKNLNFVYFKDTVDPLRHEELKSMAAERIKYTFTGYVLRSGKPLLANEEKMQNLMDMGEVSQVGQSCVSWMGVPLIIESKVGGVLAIQSYQKDILYSESDLELMTFVASHISTAIYRKRVAEKLVKMNSELKDSHAKLEEKVQLRTNELVKSNYELHKLLREREKTQAKLYHDALHDRLTGLPNRTLFIDRLLQAMNRSDSREKLKYAVLFIDLDRFKVINDSLGHLTGDLLLKEVALRLETAIRACDSVARFGGDEFCILLEGDIDKEQTITIAKRIVEQISLPYALQGYEVFTSPSVGIALCQSHYENPEEVLRDADAAMYQAKLQGKARFEFFDISMHYNALKRLQLETDLRVAIKEKELDIHYQPIVELDTKEITGFESLTRWKHHQLGFINPLEFIEIAEETGLIIELGRQILSKAIAQIAIWRNLKPEYKDLYVSVNLSPKQLEDPSLVDDILDYLEQHSLDTDSLKLEITESILINNFDVAKSVLNQFNDKGIEIMLDDFGTGFSSLSYLHHFPIKVVKIDRSFVNNMFEEAKDLAVIRSVENLASGLNMGVIAEGVETNEQFGKLKELGIECAQGYLISKPLSSKDLDKQLESRGLNWN